MSIALIAGLVAHRAKALQLWLILALAAGSLSACGSEAANAADESEAPLLCPDIADDVPDRYGRTLRAHRARLAESRVIWEGLKQRGGTYLYWSSTRRYWGGGEDACIAHLVVEDGAVTSRFESSAFGESDDIRETGADVGKQAGCLPVESVDDVYDYCEATVLCTDLSRQDVELHFDDTGVLSGCSRSTNLDDGRWIHVAFGSKTATFRNGKMDGVCLPAGQSELKADAENTLTAYQGAGFGKMACRAVVVGERELGLYITSIEPPQELATESVSCKLPKLAEGKWRVSLDGTAVFDVNVARAPKREESTLVCLPGTTEAYFETGTSCAWPGTPKRLPSTEWSLYKLNSGILSFSTRDCFDELRHCSFRVEGQRLEIDVSLRMCNGEPPEVDDPDAPQECTSVRGTTCSPPTLADGTYEVFVNGQPANQPLVLAPDVPVRLSGTLR